MMNTRLPLALAGLAALAAAGCGPTPTPAPPSAAAALTAEPGRYPPRADYLVLNATGNPSRWSSAKFPPLRSRRLAPNTPDPDLVEQVRTQLKLLDPTDFREEWGAAQSDRLARQVEAYFGSPAVPTVRVPDLEHAVATAVVRFDPEGGLGKNLRAAHKAVGSAKVKDIEAEWRAAREAAAELKLDDATLARGSVVYRRWCLQCHGPSGAGDAAYAVEGGPMPRDYRQGVFKFVTAFVPNNPKTAGLGPAGKARRADLVRTVRNGLPGSMMPAFPTLSDAEVEDVVSYVIHLSVRGEVEFATLVKGFNPADDVVEGGELDALVLRHLTAVLINWRLAERHPVAAPAGALAPAARAEAAQRGAVLYNQLCAGCHANYGRAAGFYWDAWGTVVRPRNLTLGVYRGGRGGEDLYARIYAGLPGTPMLPHAGNDALRNEPGKPDKIWDLVHFLSALSDPTDRKRLQERDPDFKLDP